MLHSLRPSPGRRVAIVALCLAAAACGDDLLSPARSPLPPEAALASPPAARAQGPAKRYRDSGARPATGRSGGAVLQAMALWYGGTTQLVASAGTLSEPDTPAGSIVKLKVRAFSPAGDELFTRTHNHLSGSTVSLSLPGLVPGTMLRLQANVRGIDGRGTRVVTLDVPVVPLPELDVVLALPAEVAPGAPANIVATVTETTDAAGMEADCVLRVDGVEADRIRALWVDAGDAVSCAFTEHFAREGTYRVEVRMENARPAGMDFPSLGAQAEPSDDGTLRVVAPRAPLRWSASLEDRTTDETRRYDYEWEIVGRARRVYRSTERTTQRTQALLFSGSAERAVAFPLAALELAVASGDSVWHRESLAGVPADGGPCVVRQVPEEGAMLHVYADAAGRTDFGYTRFGGTVTYRAEGWYNTWDVAGTLTESPTWNHGYSAPVGDAPARALGSTLALRLRVVDAQGATFGATSTLVPVAFQEPVRTEPYTCQTTYPWWANGGAN